MNDKKIPLRVCLLCVGIGRAAFRTYRTRMSEVCSDLLQYTFREIKFINIEKFAKIYRNLQWDLLSVFHWKMLFTTFLPIAAIVAWRTITATSSVLLENLLEQFRARAGNNSCSPHGFRWCWFAIRNFIYALTFRVVDERLLFDSSLFCTKSGHL